MGEGNVRPNCVFIAGFGRSGSTLLDVLLGQLPGFVSAGELQAVWERGVLGDHLCGCGTEFSECEFWVAVGKEAFGGWDRGQARHMVELQKNLLRYRRFPALLAGGGVRPDAGRGVARIAAAFGAVHRAIRDVSGADVVVDSSKTVTFALVQPRIPGVAARGIHLVRDSRGVAYSWTKRLRRPDARDPEAYFKVRDPLVVAAQWAAVNSLCRLLPAAGLPTGTMRYEALVSDPAGTLAAALAALGFDRDRLRMDFLHDGTAHLGPSHTVSGNPVRMSTGALALRSDDAWRTMLPTRTKVQVSLITLPWLARYGYITGHPG
ncbi:MAG: sulfotransferase [Actinomycetota bacterium]|nr:sulfotransferase [Actinomycetota bacterium]